MSNYIFHPRNKFPYTDFDNLFYGSYYNPYRIMAEQETSELERLALLDSAYLWGRFWEITAYYAGGNALNYMPEELGKVSIYEVEEQTETVEYFHEGFWYNANASSNEYVIYNNVDSYIRSMQPSLGAFVTYQNYEYGGFRTGIIEKIFNDGRFLFSYCLRGYDGFHTLIGNTVSYTTDIPYRGVIVNPIYQLYDNVIAGKELYYKLPFWMYKRILMKKRGEIL